MMKNQAQCLLSAISIADLVLYEKKMHEQITVSLLTTNFPCSFSMGNISKTLTLFIIVILAASSLFLLRPVYAQVGVTNPSIPGFSVTLQTYPHYIPPTYSVDPSTGKAVLTKEGYTEIAKWVGVQIGGQPFIRYNNSVGQLISLYYDVRWKDNNDSIWQSLPPPYEYYSDAADPWDPQAIGCYISIGFQGIEGPNSAPQFLDPTATQIDFQVEALIGYYNSDNVFVGQSSGWSNTQTLNVNDGSTSVNSSTLPSSSSNSTNQQPDTQSGVLLGLDWEQAAIILLVITIVALAFAMVLSRRKNTKQTRDDV
jgi:hypothetical protein